LEEISLGHDINVKVTARSNIWKLLRLAKASATTLGRLDII